MDTLAWVSWLLPPVGAAIASLLFVGAAGRACASATARRARLLRRVAITLLLACAAGSFAAIYVDLRTMREDAYLGPFFVLLGGAWWGLWAGIAATPWLGQRSDLDMTSSVPATRAAFTLLFALGLGGVGDN